jgi:hypothetical protein
MPISSPLTGAHVATTAAPAISFLSEAMSPIRSLPAFRRRFRNCPRQPRVLSLEEEVAVLCEAGRVKAERMAALERSKMKGCRLVPTVGARSGGDSHVVARKPPSI